jgi:hypothetical protein
MRLRKAEIFIVSYLIEHGPMSYVKWVEAAVKAKIKRKTIILAGGDLWAKGLIVNAGEQNDYVYRLNVKTVEDWIRIKQLKEKYENRPIKNYSAPKMPKKQVLGVSSQGNGDCSGASIGAFENREMGP